jgi:hypothetical protein
MLQIMHGKETDVFLRQLSWKLPIMTYTVLVWRKTQSPLRNNDYKNHNFEPRHNKTNIVRLRPAFIQTSLHICAVWSGSTLCAIRFSTCKRVGKRTAWILFRLRGSMLVANPLYWFCHSTAHIDLIFNARVRLNVPKAINRIYYADLSNETSIPLLQTYCDTKELCTLKEYL